MVKFFYTKEWPIIYLKSYYNIELMNDEYFEKYKKEYLTILIKCKSNKEKIILICDLTELNNCDNIPITYIMKYANFNKEIYKFNKEYVKTICILCNNKAFKNILNLFFSISKPASPYKLCSSYEKANKYLLENFNINYDVSLFENINMYNDENELSNDLEIEIETNFSNIKNITL